MNIPPPQLQNGVGTGYYLAFITIFSIEIMQLILQGLLYLVFPPLTIALAFLLSVVFSIILVGITWFWMLSNGMPVIDARAAKRGLRFILILLAEITPLLNLGVLPWYTFNMWRLGKEAKQRAKENNAKIMRAHEDYVRQYQIAFEQAEAVQMQEEQQYRETLQVQQMKEDAALAARTREIQAAQAQEITSLVAIRAQAEAYEEYEDRKIEELRRIAQDPLGPLPDHRFKPKSHLAVQK